MTLSFQPYNSITPKSVIVYFLFKIRIYYVVRNKKETVNLGDNGLIYNKQK